MSSPYKAPERLELPSPGGPGQVLEAQVWVLGLSNRIHEPEYSGTSGWAISGSKSQGPDGRSMGGTEREMEPGNLSKPQSPAKAQGSTPGPVRAHTAPYG